MLVRPPLSTIRHVFACVDKLAKIDATYSYVMKYWMRVCMHSSAARYNALGIYIYCMHCSYWLHTYMM